MITRLKELLKAICKSVVRIVFCVVGIIVFCVYSSLIYNTYRYYTGVEYKYYLTQKVYDNLIIYTGQLTPPLRIINSDIINAWTDGKTITFTSGILKVLDNEDEIATIMAHEMAHNMLAHTYDIDEFSTLNQINKEAHADKVGVYLMLRAGYDICKGKDIWIKFRSSENGEMADPGDHPGFSYRYYQEQMPWCKE